MVKPAAQRGFALVDAIVASVVLALALVGVIGLTTEALSSQQQGEEIATAARLADEQLNLVLALGPEGYASRFPLRAPCEAPFQRYRYELEIGPATLGEAHPVVVTVVWSSGLRERTFIVETRVAPRIGDDPDPERQPDATLGREGA